MRIAFLHGLESGPHGSKYHALAQRWPDLLAPDCEGEFDVQARKRRVTKLLAGQGPVVLVGSSFGGLIAALLADENAGQDDAPVDIRGLVLCAPALHIPAAEAIERCPVPCVIVHGRDDDVVPIDASRAYAARFGLPLIEVNDGHRLAASQDRLVAETAALLRRLAGEDAATTAGEQA